MLSNLAFLAINTNALQGLPESIRHLTKLTHFYANKNNISQLPSSLIDCKALRRLNVANNPIRHIMPEMKQKWQVVTDLTTPEPDPEDTRPFVNLSGSRLSV